MKKSSAFRTTVVLLTAVIALIAAPLGHGALVAAWGNNLSGQTAPPNGITNAVAIAAGGYHNLVLKGDGTVGGWGDNFYGEARNPAGLEQVTAIAAGLGHSLALRMDGSVVGWGNNADGECLVPEDLTSARAIAAGADYSVALREDGTVAVWGRGSEGQTNVPAGLANVKAIAGGGRHCLALKSDGTVAAWGYNASGQANVPPGLANVVAIGAGTDHSLALKADGTVVAWGSDSFGQCAVPTNLTDVVAISCGFYHNLALRAGGEVVAWGDNSEGQVVVPGALTRATAIAAGGTHSVALVKTGPIQLVQQPVSQEVHNGSDVSFTVVATGAAPLSYQWYFKSSPTVPSAAAVSGATNASLTLSNVQFSAMGVYAVEVSNAFGSVISTDATLNVLSPPFFTSQPSTNQVVRAGTNLILSAVAAGTSPLMYQWQLNGTNLAGRTSPTLSLVNLQPGGSGIYSLVVTNFYGSAQVDVSLTVTDSAPYFVRQPFGQLPDQTTTTNPVVPIGGRITLNAGVLGSAPLMYQWRFQGADIPGATNVTLALSNMVVAQTGFYSLEVRNAFGSAISAKLFVNVVQVYMWDPKFVAATNVPANLTNVVGLAAGYSHVVALKSDGRVAVWGGSPLLPAGAITNIPSGVTNVAAIAAGGNCSMVLRSNGTVVVWGTTASQTNTPPGATNIMAIAAGNLSCLAVRSNGTVLAWGSGATQLPAGLSNVIAVAAGSVHNLALKSDGRVVAWGTPYGLTTNIIAGLSNVIAIDVAGTFSAALRDDGKVFGWNSGATPLLTTLSNVVGVAAGESQISAIKADGSIASWFSGRAISTVALTNVIALANGEQGGFTVAALGSGAPAFTVQPASQGVARGDTVRLQARTAGLQPTTYQWQFQGVNLADATNTTLVVSNIQATDLGAYRCVASNARGTTTSNPALLGYGPFAGTLPQALNAANLQWFQDGQQPGWFAQNRETHGDEAAGQSGATTNGGQSILQTIVTGPGTLTFWWKVSSEEGYDFLRFTELSGATSLRQISGETEWQQVTQLLSAGTHTLRWIYSKDVSVSAGRDAGWLDEVAFVPDPPTIVRQPFDKTAVMGENVTIPAVASSAVPVAYQWLKNGTNIAGATGAYLTLTNVTRRDSAIYALRVSNASGSVTSSNAVLRVLVPQRLGSLGQGDDGALEIISGDADAGTLWPEDLTAFEAQTSEDLLNWTALPHSLSVTNGALLLRDADGILHRQRFYRIVEH